MPSLPRPRSSAAASPGEPVSTSRGCSPSTTCTFDSRSVTVAIAGPVPIGTTKRGPGAHATSATAKLASAQRMLEVLDDRHGAIATIELRQLADARRRRDVELGQHATD